MKSKRMSKNPNAVALGKASWKKRKKNPNHKKQLSEAGKAGALARWKKPKLEKAIKEILEHPDALKLPGER